MVSPTERTILSPAPSSGSSGKAHAMTNAWNPAQYLAFNDERTRPARDLIARVPLQDPRHVVDLGCGPGNSTQALKQRWQQARVIGLDNDSAMLEKARNDDPTGLYAEADATVWRPDPDVDLVFSNAVLQWVGGHSTLFPALLQSLRPGAVLAIQMPGNFRAPSHRLLAETVASHPLWKQTVTPALRSDPVAEPEDYYRLLSPFSASLDVWETTYIQPLTGVDPVFNWTRSTAQRPVIGALRSLPDGEQEVAAFQAAYAERLRHAYPPEADGRTLFSFRRIFMVAVRA